MNRYSVSDLSKLFNLSRQTIYTKFDTILKDFVKVDDKGKYLDKLGLEEFTRLQNSQVSINLDSKIDKEIQQIDDTFYKKQIEFSQSQLIAKDDQIKILLERIEQSQKLVENSQILLREKENTTINKKIPWIRKLLGIKYNP